MCPNTRASFNLPGACSRLNITKAPIPGKDEAQEEREEGKKKLGGISWKREHSPATAAINIIISNAIFFLCNTIVSKSTPQVLRDADPWQCSESVIISLNLGQI